MFIDFLSFFCHFEHKIPILDIMTAPTDLEKLNDPESLAIVSAEAPLGKIPDWLLKKKPVSETYMRVMVILFFFSIGFVAASSCIDADEYSFHALVVPTVVTVNFLCGFFLNQRIFVPRLYFARKIKSFIFVNFIYTVVTIFIRDVAVCSVGSKAGTVYEALGTDHSLTTILGIFCCFAVVTVILCAFNVAMRIGGIRAQEVYIRKLQENFLLQADLAFLKQQLSSHFLFNTLNNITALVDIDPKLAQKSMIRLSSVLRQILHETKEKSVTLETEVDILQTYCELEKLRFGSNMEFSFETQLEHPTKNVSPLLMMPLVENAIKYGVHPSQKSRIAISISEKDDVLHCHVENTIVPKASSTHVKSGIGLANLRRRLEVCYPNKYRYETRTVNGTYIADLEISLKDAPLTYEEQIANTGKVFKNVDEFHQAIKA